MRATITKVHPLEFGKKFHAAFHRVEFKTESGAWAKTDVVPSFRNFARWSGLLIPGTVVGGLKVDGALVDADSPVYRISKAPHNWQPMPAKKPEPVKDPQMDLL